MCALRPPAGLYAFFRFSLGHCAAICRLLPTHQPPLDLARAAIVKNQARTSRAGARIAIVSHSATSKTANGLCSPLHRHGANPVCGRLEAGCNPRSPRPAAARASMQYQRGSSPCELAPISQSASCAAVQPAGRALRAGIPPPSTSRWPGPNPTACLLLQTRGSARLATSPVDLSEELLALAGPRATLTQTGPTPAAALAGAVQLRGHQMSRFGRSGVFPSP